MKKIIIVILFCLTIYTGSKMTSAQHYTVYAEIALDKGKFLVDHEYSELEPHYNEVKKSKFSGWNIKHLNKRVRMHYTKERLGIYINDGYTPMSYKHKIERKIITKYDFSVAGTLGFKINKTKGAFTGGLDSSLKASYSNQMQIETKDAYDLDVLVDPGTQLIIMTVGSGYLTNGVAASYSFWIQTNLGGFEYFQSSEEYQVMVKTQL